MKAYPKFDKFFLFFIILFLFTGQSTGYAALLNGVRPLGMGNAFTAVSDDENAVFYNPAGLSDISTLQLGVINPQVEVAGDSIDFAQDAKDIDFDDTGEVADLLREYTGESQYAKLSLFPHFGLNALDSGILVGVLGQSTAIVETHNPVWPQADVNLNADYGPVVGAGIQVPGFENLRVGMGLKYIHRDSLDEIYTPAEIASDDFEDQIDDDLNSGSGVSADIGLIYDADLVPFMDTKIGLSVLNIPEMSMGDADPIKSQYNIGFAVGKKLGFCDIVGALDVQDFTQNAIEENEWSKRVHIGGEVQFPFVALRTGLYDGYLSAGASLDIKLFRFDIATFGSENGAFAGQDEERRYVAQVTIGW